MTETLATPATAPFPEAAAERAALIWRGRLTLPTSPLGRTVLAAALAAAHVAVVVSLGTGVVLTWALVTLPGLALLACSPAARGRWYRYPIVWALVFTSGDNVSALAVLGLGQAWAFAQWLGERHEHESLSAPRQPVWRALIRRR